MRAAKNGLELTVEFLVGKGLSSHLFYSELSLAFLFAFERTPL